MIHPILHRIQDSGFRFPRRASRGGTEERRNALLRRSPGLGASGVPSPAGGEHFSLAILRVLMYQIVALLGERKVGSAARDRLLDKRQLAVILSEAKNPGSYWSQGTTEILRCPDQIVTSQNGGRKGFSAGFTWRVVRPTTSVYGRAVSPPDPACGVTPG